MQLLKKITLLFAFLVILSACVGNKKIRLRASENIKGKAVYGDSIKYGNTFDLDAIPIALGKEEKMDMRIKGVVENVCKANGSWITMKLADGKTLWITFKDEKFSVPQSVRGKSVVINGIAYKNSISVNHPDSIMSKTESSELKPDDKNTMAFQATGLVVL